MSQKQVKQLDRVIIRFAGDSGDGMQLTGDRFTQESAVFGNDLMTLPTRQPGDSPKADEFLVGIVNHQHPDHDTEHWPPAEGFPA